MFIHSTFRNPLQSLADFGDGPGTASCDLLAVKGVLSTMIDAKVEHLWSQDLVFEARIYAGMKHWFMRGLPSSNDDTKVDASGADSTVSVKEGLAAAIKMFRWRGEAKEAEETHRSGLNLLFWSTLADNLGAVRALAKEGNEVIPFHGGQFSFSDSVRAASSEGNPFPGGRLRFHRPGKH